MTKAKKEIKITCIGSDFVDINVLQPFQGELKELSEKAYKKYKNSILKFGFSEPVSVWLDEATDVYFILNGHQKVKTCIRMQSEGYIIPQIPINLVDCKDENEAKEKILAFASQYGEITDKSLQDYCADFSLDVDDMLSSYRFPELKLEVETNDGKTDLAEKNDGNDSAKKATIKVKCTSEDKDEIIKKITEIFKDWEGVEIK